MNVWESLVLILGVFLFTISVYYKEQQVVEKTIFTKVANFVRV